MIEAIRILKNLLTRLLEWVVTLLVATLVLDVLWGVFSRFVLASPSRWTEEVATILLIWVSLLGAAVAFSRKEHLGVDYLVKKLDPAARRLMTITGQLLIIWFASAAMIYGGYILVSKALASGQVSPALGLKFGYVYLAVPLSGLFIVLFAIEQATCAIRGLDPIAEDDAEE